MIHILLLDDEIIESKLVDFALKKTLGSGYQLDFALTLEQAVECLKTKAYNLILLDNIMPKGLSAKTSLPHLIPHKGDAEVAVISSLIEEDILRNDVGPLVDDIVDKFYLQEYFSKKFGTAA